jgi:hypothetical protein
MNLIGYSSFVYPIHCRQMNYCVVFLLLYLALGLMLYMNYDHVFIIVGISIVHDKNILLIERWSLT